MEKNLVIMIIFVLASIALIVCLIKKNQKDKKDLLQVKTYLEDVGIRSGLLHNPSKKVDPNYWRFFVRAKSYSEFAKIISSSHPEKISFLRMKI